MNTILTRLRRTPARMFRAVAAHYRGEQAWRRARHRMDEQEPENKANVAKANELRHQARDAFFAKNFHEAARRYELAAVFYEAACAFEWAADARLMAGAARARLNHPVAPPRPILVAVAGERVA